jgi:MFS family permease
MPLPPFSQVDSLTPSVEPVEIDVIVCASGGRFLRVVKTSRSLIYGTISAVLVLVSVLRIVESYPHTAQAFDEPCHISAGMEFIDRGTYTLDAIHPPLARIAIALPLYLAGLRYPVLPQADPDSHNYNVIGNRILYDGDRLQHKLTLARLGVIPFFLLGAMIVSLWTRLLAGNAAGLIALFLYCTTPTVLAFSSIAYTDIVAASTQVAAMFAIASWLDEPNRARTLWLGLAVGAALLAKLTTLVFLPAAALAMVLVWLLGQRRQSSARSIAFKKLLSACALSALVVWAGYRFSLRHLNEVTGITASAMPSFQHFPAPLRSAARTLISLDPRLPAPELLHGLGLAWVLNATPTSSYLLGHIKSGGWWYFYLVGLGMKTPLPLLVLFAVSLAVLFLRKSSTDKDKSARDTTEENDFKIFLPLAALSAVLLVTTHVNYQVGMRHILVAFPLIAIVAGLGSGVLLDRAIRQSLAPRIIGIVIIVVLLIGQAVESFSAQSDFLAYFNQLAGKDPSRVLATGCDLDCGQDLARLAQELHSRHINKCALAIWTSADITRSGLPQNDMPSSLDNFHGCIAVSSRAFRLGDFLKQSLGPNSFTWLERYRPLADIGKTIRLYDIPNNLEATSK